MSGEPLQSQSKEPRIEAALRDYLERINRGLSVNREEFVSQYPDIAPALGHYIAAEEELRKLAGDKASRESAAVSTRSFPAQGQETVFVPNPSPDLTLVIQSERSGGTAASALSGQFGRYQIIRPLGRGAMGTVYLAEDTQLKRPVAIKTPHFEDDPTGEVLKRFYREAKAAAILRHPNICPVYDVGEIEGKHFISMAYIVGRPLSDLIQRDKSESDQPQSDQPQSDQPQSDQPQSNQPQSDRRQRERQILITVHKLAEAIQEAHDYGIVHRDLKPANIMVDQKGEPIIMDFGLARKPTKEGDARLTHSGVILGSPAYMSPEQIEGKPEKIGPSSDQYSLGVILYEMLTWQLPFRGKIVSVLAQVLTKEPTRPNELRPGIDPRIETICLTMMAKQASDRFPSMQAVAQELDAILKSPGGKPAANNKPATAAPRPVALKPWREWGWIPWAALAFGLAVCAAIAVVMVSYRHGETLPPVVVDESAQQIVDKSGPTSEKASDAESGRDKPADKTDPGPPLGVGGIRLLLAPFDTVSAKKGQETCSARLHTPVELTNSIGMKLVLIPPGQFRMGSTRDQAELVLPLVPNPAFCEPERPAFTARILRPFYLGADEVTRGEFAKFVSATGYKIGVERDRRPPDQEFENAKGENVDWRDPGYPQQDSHPVVDVTWADAAAFCKWLSRLDGHSYRLPREAEWEHACRAGTTTLFYTGDDPAKAAEIANMQGAKDGYPFTAPVHSFPPNPFGLHDMYGNVWEMCQDAGTPNYAGHNAEGEPPSSADPSTGIARGGGADCPAWYCRSAFRTRDTCAGRSNNRGFRVACDIAAATAPTFFGRPFAVRGDWKIENEELVQPTAATGTETPFLAFGEEWLLDYDLSVEVQKTGGDGAVGIRFRWQGPQHYRQFSLAPNDKIDFSCVNEGKPSRRSGDWKELRYSTNRWYLLKIEIRRYVFRAFLDGELQFEQADARFNRGRMCLFADGAAARFRRIKVNDLQGKPLLEGLPNLESK